MDAAALQCAAPAEAARLDTGRLRDIVLVRIATARRALARDGLAKELAPIAAAAMPAAAFRAALDRDIAALADAGLVDARAVGVEATEAGRKRAVLVLGGRGGLPRSWAEARDTRLMARALGIENEAPARLRKLAKPDGLRAVLVQRAFGLKIRGVASPVRLRTALAALALDRAFGNKVSAEVPARTGLSAKAGRTLAGQLSNSPQDYRTDSRLIGALAAEHVGARSGDLGQLQLAILRRYVTPSAVSQQATRSRPKRKARPARPEAVKAQAVPAHVAPAQAASHGQTQPTPPQLRLVTPPQPAALAPPAAPAASGGGSRPDVARFAQAVRAVAETVAEGWAGNRKAFVSRIWSRISDSHAGWGLTEIEFKCMLAEAHRTGALVLANADLKDQRNLRDVQASAIAYRNAVFHLVRVDD
jgi:hypothetical protein